MSSADILARLATVLEDRKRADPSASYVASLYAKGLDAMLKKIGEEATETVMAAKDGDPQRMLHEVADLWFHCLVMLTYRGISPAAVLVELERRFDRSGIEEEPARAPRV